MKITKKITSMTLLIFKAYCSCCIFILLHLQLTHGFTTIARIKTSGRTTTSSFASSTKTSLNLFFRQKQEQKLDDNDTTATTSNYNEKDTVNYMEDLIPFLNYNDSNNKDEAKKVNDTSMAVDQENTSLGTIIGLAGLGFAIVASFVFNSMGISIPEVSVIANNLNNLLTDPTSTLESVVNSVQSMGALGFLYFGAAYTIAEILAIPAIPLTASAGYLFGVRDGTIVVLLSASIAAAVSFVIGRTFLRQYVVKALENYPDFQRIDRAIGEEGFKLMLLLRISPIFPFALSNYFYGATRIGFWPYFFGTMIGFSPGTIAYVYTGQIGKSLTLDVSGSEPWYIYAGVLAAFSVCLKFVADVASGIIDKMEEEEAI